MTKFVVRMIVEEVEVVNGEIHHNGEVYGVDFDEQFGSKAEAVSRCDCYAGMARKFDEVLVSLDDILS